MPEHLPCESLWSMPREKLNPCFAVRAANTPARYQNIKTSKHQNIKTSKT